MKETWSNMKKKIFTMGKVYDLGTLGVNEVENAVQADLDKVFNAGGVKFKVREVSGKTLELTFFRKYREGEIDWLNYDPKLIYNSKHPIKYTIKKRLYLLSS